MKKVLLVVLVFCTVLSFAQKLLIHPSDTIKETLIIKPGLVSESSTYVLNNTNAQINPVSYTHLTLPTNREV